LRDFISDAFVVNTLRGMDSSGIFQIDKDNNPFLHKQNVPGFMFAETKAVKRFIADVDTCPVTVGHVRAATAGKVTVDNAHPFVAERADGTRLIGVHNGTLTGWQQQPGAKEYEVDSDWALNLIAAEGVDAFEKFNGAYCFVWWDEQKPDKLFMARNDDRPMHFVMNKTKDTILFGSESGMVTWLADRRKIEMDDSIYSLESYKLYAFDLSVTGKVSWAKTNVPRFKYVAPPRSVYTREYPATNAGRWNAATAKWDYPDGTSRSSYEREQDDDWRHNGYTPGYGVRGGNASVPGDSFPESGKQFVAGFKRTLEANRTARAAAESSSSTATDSTVTTTIKLQPDSPKVVSKREQRRLRAAARHASKQTPPADTAKRVSVGPIFDDKTGEYTAPSHWYSTQGATTAEQQQAKSLGVMGSIEFMTGVIYEPETGELLGDIQEWVSGSGKIDHVGIVRNISGHNAKARWIDNGGQWCVVIGVTDAHSGVTGRTLIVSELTEVGKQQMRQAAA
jgi:hypothetical protein